MKHPMSWLAGFAAGALAVLLLDAMLARRGGLQASPVADDYRLPRNDEELRARIRGRLGHVLARPQLCQVEVEQGSVRLKGEVRRSEVHPLMSLVRGMLGVREVLNMLSVEDGDSPASRQGELPLSPAGTPWH